MEARSTPGMSAASLFLQIRALRTDGLASSSTVVRARGRFKVDDLGGLTD